MKLRRALLVETLRLKNEGKSSYQVRKIAGISKRRVDQVYQQYVLTGEIPEIGRAVGRPTRPTSPQEVTMIDQAYKHYRVCASNLEPLIEQDYGVHIPHNRIHKILLQLGHSKAKPKKDVRKKNWIRYERRHSLTAVHIDWHFCAKSRKWVFAVLDDASRLLLTLLEVSSPTTEASIEGMRKALTYGVIRQCISDHGCQFTSNRGTLSKFGKFLKRHGIRHILCRIKHPQSNGKVEKFFHLYERHRHSFSSKNSFIQWYNEVRPHMALRRLETPAHAFERKLKVEV